MNLTLSKTIMNNIQTILRNIQSTKVLLSLCEYKRIYLSKKQQRSRKKILTALSRKIEERGLLKLMSIFPLRELEVICDCIDPDISTTEVFRQHMVNAALEVYEEEGLDQIMKRMDKKPLFYAWRYIEQDYTQNIEYFSLEDLKMYFYQNVAGFGLYNFFTSLSVPELKEVCVACEMLVKTCSKEKIVDLLMDQNLKSKKNGGSLGLNEVSVRVHWKGSICEKNLKDIAKNKVLIVKEQRRDYVQE